MELMLRGGLLMWPILLESILALWVILERWMFAAVVLPRRRRALDDFTDSIGNPDGSTPEAVSAELRDLVRAVDRANEDGAVNRTLLALQGDRLVREAERNLTLLNVVAQTAPLFGLLGTVTGLIRAFVVIQSLSGQVTPSDLAGGIWEALLTTAFGLFVGIPALIAYIGFNRVADRYAQVVEAALSQIIHKLSKAGLEIV